MNHRYMFEDTLVAMEILIEEGIKADAVITDLPFGTTNCKWDSVIPLHAVWYGIERLKMNSSTPAVMFAQTPFDKVLGVSNLSQLKYEWIWEKTQATGHLNAKKMPMKSHENILVFAKKPPLYTPQKTNGHKPVNSYTKYVDTQNNTDLYNRMNREISGGGETDRYPRSVIKFPSDKQKLNLHSTQKPEALCEYLVKTYTKPGWTVLSPDRPP